MTDHDLLVELRTEFRGVRADIKELKDTTSARVAALESDKLGVKEFATHLADADGKLQRVLGTQSDHETRLRWLERSLYIGFGIIIILEALLSMFGRQIVDALLK